MYQLRKYLIKGFDFPEQANFDVLNSNTWCSEAYGKQKEITYFEVQQRTWVIKEPKINLF